MERGTSRIEVSMSALKQSANFLAHIYNEDMYQVARIFTAESEKNYEFLIQGLDEVIDYASRLKSQLNESNYESK